MADNVELNLGTSDVYCATEEVTANIHRQKIGVANVSACLLKKGQTVCQLITCQYANTPVQGTAIPSGTRYAVVYCASTCVIAMGAQTSNTNGVAVAAGTPTVFPVIYTNGGADDQPWVQSPTAGAIVRLTWMRD